METREGLVIVDDDEEAEAAHVHSLRASFRERSLEVLNEMCVDFHKRGMRADPEGYTAIRIAIFCDDIDLYRANRGGTQPAVYNVWDLHKRERVEVQDWLANYGKERGK